MAKILPQKQETSPANPQTTGWSGSLFPAQPKRARPRPSITSYLAELIGGRKKSVAVALRPHASVETALAALDHALVGTGKKRIGVDEIDAILDELGADDEARFMAFFAERRGWKSERMTTLEWALRQLDEVRAETRRGAAIADKVDRIEEVIRAFLEEQD